MRSVAILVFFTCVALLLGFAIFNLPYNGVFLIILLVAIVTYPSLNKSINWKA